MAYHVSNVNVVDNSHGGNVNSGVVYFDGPGSTVEMNVNITGYSDAVPDDLGIEAIEYDPEHFRVDIIKTGINDFHVVVTQIGDFAVSGIVFKSTGADTHSSQRITFKQKETNESSSSSSESSSESSSSTPEESSSSQEQSSSEEESSSSEQSSESSSVVSSSSEESSSKESETSSESSSQAQESSESVDNHESSESKDSESSSEKQGESNAGSKTQESEQQSKQQSSRKSNINQPSTNTKGIRTVTRKSTSVSGTRTTYAVKTITGNIHDNDINNNATSHIVVPVTIDDKLVKPVLKHQHTEVKQPTLPQTSETLNWPSVVIGVIILIAVFGWGIKHFGDDR